MTLSGFCCLYRHLGREGPRESCQFQELPEASVNCLLSILNRFFPELSIFTFVSNFCCFFYFSVKILCLNELPSKKDSFNHGRNCYTTSCPLVFILAIAIYVSFSFYNYEGIYFHLSTNHSDKALHIYFAFIILFLGEMFRGFDLNIC